MPADPTTTFSFQKANEFTSNSKLFNIDVNAIRTDVNSVADEDTDLQEQQELAIKKAAELQAVVADADPAFRPAAKVLHDFSFDEEEAKANPLSSALVNAFNTAIVKNDWSEVETLFVSNGYVEFKQKFNILQYNKLLTVMARSKRYKFRNLSPDTFNVFEDKYASFAKFTKLITFIFTQFERPIAFFVINVLINAVYRIKDKSSSSVTTFNTILSL